MKKKFICILMITVFIFSNLSALAENSSSLSGAIDALWLKNISEDLTNRMKESYSRFVNNKVTDIMSAPAYIREKNGLIGDDSNQSKQIIDQFEVDYGQGLGINTLNINKYIKQYYENGCLSYLFDSTKYWVVPLISNGKYMIFDKNGNCIQENDGIADDIYHSAIMLKSGVDFLKDTDRIEALLLEHNETAVDDIKIVIMDSFFTFLYLRCDQREYFIRLYAGRTKDENLVSDIECFQLYSVDEVLEKIINYNNTNSYWDLAKNILEKKAVYLAEAEQLQSEGLILGNESGLDLLKPLTRAEAVTLLVRSLGLDSEASQYTVSSFSDIPSNNWASPYASLARAKGIAYGVSDTEFNPNASVTADQFASFTLRAMGESDFDYTEGLEILIDKGIITEEEAETMDLFTRGDMAKIVYEAKEKNLL